MTVSAFIGKLRHKMFFCHVIVYEYSDIFSAKYKKKKSSAFNVFIFSYL